MKFDDVDGDVSPGGVFHRIKTRHSLRIFTANDVSLCFHYSTKEEAAKNRDAILQLIQEKQIYAHFTNNDGIETTIILSAIQYMVVE